MCKHFLGWAILSVTFFLTGCGSMSIPTGLSEDKYLDPDGTTMVATYITGTAFNSSERWVELNINQIRLAQLHSVPQYLWQSGTEVSLVLKETKAKPSSIFKWEPISKSRYSIHEALREVSISAPGSTQLEIPVRFRSGQVELDLNDVIQKIRPNVEYTISCPRCEPYLLGLRGKYSDVPSPPQLNTVAKFVINSSEYNLIKRRVQEKNAATARLERERKQAERIRQQELAQEKREREAQIRKADADRKLELTRIAREGDGSSDDLLCKKYGFKPNTQSYANCRMQIDVAKREMQQQQAFYQAQQQQIQQAQEAERKRRQSAFMLGMGLRMMGGQSASGAAIDQSVGAPMYQPPPPSSRTYTLPNGRMMTCTSNGSFTNCY